MICVQALAGSASNWAVSLALRARKVMNVSSAACSSARPAPVVTLESKTSSSGALPVACCQWRANAITSEAWSALVQAALA